jgi:ADP-heptose:LPS heptosyltransferase
LKKNHIPATEMKNILVLRLSSMGDVLLTIPVIRGILQDNPDLQLVLVTRHKFATYFSGIDRLIILAFHPDGVHHGLMGLTRLFREIRRYRYSCVIDLHSILRTWILDVLLTFTGCRVYRIRKYRKLRRMILSRKNHGLIMPHTVTRYFRVFEQAGLTGKLSDSGFPPADGKIRSGIIQKATIRIGIAPLSKHITKNWGLDHVSQLISLLRSQYHTVEIHLFGGSEDQTGLNSLSGPDVINHAGFINPADELSTIRLMDVFISMDSANMHLASLAGVRTISIWGGTDPSLGFAPVGQPDEYALRADPAEVYCRPCSVYGEVPCRRTDFPMICMKTIKPEQVLDKIKEILSLS